MLYLTTGVALATLLAMGGILLGPALADCYGKPGGAALCLQSKFSSIDIPPLQPEPPASEPKVGDTAPVPALGLAATGVTIAPPVEASIALVPNPGTVSLSVTPGVLPLTANSSLAPGQGDLTADASFVSPPLRGSVDFSVAPGRLDAQLVPLAPGLSAASLVGEGRIAASGQGGFSSSPMSEAAMLALSEGAIAITLANYQPPAFGGALLAYLPPEPPLELPGSLAATGIFAAPPPAGTADLVAPPPVAEIIVDPVPAPITPAPLPPVAGPETLSPNVTVLPPPLTGGDSAIVVLGGG